MSVATEDEQASFREQKQPPWERAPCDVLLRFDVVPEGGAEKPTACLELRAHARVLAAFSEVLKGYLKFEKEDGGGQGQGQDVQQLVWVLQSAEELVAADVLVTWMYKGWFGFFRGECSSTCSSSSTTRLPTLLRTLKLADALLVDRFASECAPNFRECIYRHLQGFRAQNYFWASEEAAAAADTSYFNAADRRYVFHEFPAAAPAHLVDHAAVRAVHDAVGRALAGGAFLDVADMLRARFKEPVTQRERDGEFALRVWWPRLAAAEAAGVASSPGLRTHGENDVLVLLAAWLVGDNSSNVADFGAQAARRLHLGELSTTYLSYLRLVAPWLTPDESALARALQTRLAERATAQRNRERQPRDFWPADSFEVGRDALSDMCLRAAEEAAAEEKKEEAAVSSADGRKRKAARLTPAGCGGSRTAYFHGFDLTYGVSVEPTRPRPSGKATGSVEVKLFLEVNLAEPVRALCDPRLLLHPPEVVVDATVSLGPREVDMATRSPFRLGERKCITLLLQRDAPGEVPSALFGESTTAALTCSVTELDGVKP
jgi:hypothetical protein